VDEHLLDHVDRLDRRVDPGEKFLILSGVFALNEGRRAEHQFRGTPLHSDSFSLHLKLQVYARAAAPTVCRRWAGSIHSAMIGMKARCFKSY
jgi:hypothetical protein